MKYSTAIATIVAAADIVSAGDPGIQAGGPPFKLTVHSTDASNGKILKACFNGAAIEALCIDDQLDDGIFQIHDTTKSKRSGALTDEGYLTHAITVNMNCK